jgi:hypothetical protein
MGAVWHYRQHHSSLLASIRVKDWTYTLVQVCGYRHMAHACLQLNALSSKHQPCCCIA